VTGKRTGLTTRSDLHRKRTRTDVTAMKKENNETGYYGERYWITEI